MHLKRMCSVAFRWSVLYISIKSIWSNGSFKASVSRFIFYLDDLSIDVSEVLKSPTIIGLLSISPFMSVHICFIYSIFRCSYAGCIYIHNCYIFFLD